jgi:hypothetical protein
MTGNAAKFSPRMSATAQLRNTKMLISLISIDWWKAKEKSLEYLI